MQTRRGTGGTPVRTGAVALALALAALLPLARTDALGTAATSFSSSASVAPHATVPVRTLFAWSSTDRDVVDFAVERRVGLIYLNANPGFSRDADGTAALVQEARDAGLAVYALAGAPDWAARPARVREWAREVLESGLFDGMLVDIEPYVEPRWSDEEGRRALVRGYLRALRAGRRAAGGLPFHATIPFWFDHDAYTDDRGTLADEVISTVDGIVVLAYRDRAEGRDGIVALSEYEVLSAAAAGKPVVVAIQTAEDQLDKLTFFEEGNEAMEAELRTVAQRFAETGPSPAIGIHYYRSYRSLAP